MRNYTIRVANTAVTAQLTCAFVFVQAKVRFSHDAAQLMYFKILLFSFCTNGMHRKTDKPFVTTIANRISQYNMLLTKLS